jgi:HEPN domain-containing protein
VRGGCYTTPGELKAIETREWLAKAADDLESARVLIAAGRFGAALFHCQQSAEKSLKAFLTWHERPFRKTHDIKELGGVCDSIDESLAALLAQAEGLSVYAWKLRYPGAAYTPTLDEPEKMFALAQRVFGDIRARLPV